MLQFMRSQRVRHDWVTELNWTERDWMEELACILKPNLMNPKTKQERENRVIKSNPINSKLTDFKFNINPIKCNELKILIIRKTGKNWRTKYTLSQEIHLHHEIQTYWKQKTRKWYTMKTIGESWVMWCYEHQTRQIWRQGFLLN